jgi:hypothetical protein
MDTKGPFEGAGSASVFDDVRKQITAQETRALWARIMQEQDRGGVSAAAKFVESEFDEIAVRLRRELSAIKDNG